MPIMVALWKCRDGTESRSSKKIAFLQQKNIVQFASSEEIDKESHEPNMSFTLTATSLDVSLMDFYLLRKSFIYSFCDDKKKQISACISFFFALCRCRGRSRVQIRTVSLMFTLLGWQMSIFGRWLCVSPRTWVDKQFFFGFLLLAIDKRHGLHSECSRSMMAFFCLFAAFPSHSLSRYLIYSFALVP